MLAVVKRHHTDKTLFEIKGDVPSDVMSYLQDKFGHDIEVVDDDNEYVNIFNTTWYKEVKNSTTPGETIKIYRENLGLTQAELGKKLGKFSRQKISDMERGVRSISKEVAKKLSQLFEVSADRFI